MDKAILDKLSFIGDNFEENPERCSYFVYCLLEEMIDNLKTNDLSKLLDLKRTLDDETLSYEITNYRNYALGKIHALIELGNLINAHLLKNNKGEIL